jgi:hypothetical protein
MDYVKYFDDFYHSTIVCGGKVVRIIVEEHDDEEVWTLYLDGEMVHQWLTISRHSEEPEE